MVCAAKRQPPTDKRTKNVAHLASLLSVLPSHYASLQKQKYGGSSQNQEPSFHYYTLTFTASTEEQTNDWNLQMHIKPDDTFQSILTHNSPRALSCSTHCYGHFDSHVVGQIVTALTEKSSFKNNPQEWYGLRNERKAPANVNRLVSVWKVCSMQGNSMLLYTETVH